MIGGLTSATVGTFTPQKLAETTCQHTTNYNVLATCRLAVIHVICLQNRWPVTIVITDHLKLWFSGPGFDPEVREKII